MRNFILCSIFSIVFFSACGSNTSFKSFFNTHKTDLGVTAFQVPNFMRTLLTTISPEMKTLFGNVKDFKFITFNDISSRKQLQLLHEMNLITANNFTDMLRSNQPEKTKIISVKEKGDVITQAIIFNTTLAKTSVFYLKGTFNPAQIRKLAAESQFENLSNTLVKNYNTTAIPYLNAN